MKKKKQKWIVVICALVGIALTLIGWKFDASDGANPFRYLTIISCVAFIACTLCEKRK